MISDNINLTLSSLQYEVVVPFLADFISHWMAEIGGTNYLGFCSGGHIINTYLAYINTITYVSYTRCGEKEELKYTGW